MGVFQFMENKNPFGNRSGEERRKKEAERKAFLEEKNKKNNRRTIIVIMSVFLVAVLIICLVSFFMKKTSFLNDHGRKLERETVETRETEIRETKIIGGDQYTDQTTTGEGLVIKKPEPTQNTEERETVPSVGRETSPSSSEEQTEEPDSQSASNKEFKELFGVPAFLDSLERREPSKEEGRLDSPIFERSHYEKTPGKMDESKAGADGRFSSPDESPYVSSVEGRKPFVDAKDQTVPKHKVSLLTGQAGVYLGDSASSLTSEKRDALIREVRRKVGLDVKLLGLLPSIKNGYTSDPSKAWLGTDLPNMYYTELTSEDLELFIANEIDRRISPENRGYKFNTCPAEMPVKGNISYINVVSDSKNGLVIFSVNYSAFYAANLSFVEDSFTVIYSADKGLQLLSDENVSTKKTTIKTFESVEEMQSYERENNLSLGTPEEGNSNSGINEESSFVPAPPENDVIPRP